MSASPLPLFDIGVNLSHESYDHDREAVIERALQIGLTGMLLTGTSISCSERAASIAATLPGTLFSTAGVHPHEAAHWGIDSSARLHAISQQPQVVAIGETGLDFNRDFSPRDLQERAFAEQLELASATGLPVFLHQRDAHERFLPILREQRDRLSGGVVHCFTGSREELHAYLDLDMYIGITGWICDERRGLALQELVRDIPGERLLLETDAPYLLPRNMDPKPRGRRNEPAWLPWVLRMVAACRGETEASIASSTTDNARRCFRL